MVLLFHDRRSIMRLWNMTTIRQLSYKTDFYWKGDRYRQLVRAKVIPGHPKPKDVFCYKLYDIFGKSVYMPLGRTVKPVIKLKLGELK